MEPRQRLFFALWPEPALVELLQARGASWLQQTNGRPVAAENFHTTLVFLGSVSATQRDCLEQQAQVIRLPRFELTLDRLAFWPRPQVVWAGSSAPSESFTRLASMLRQAAMTCGLSVDQRPPIAHLTLKRKVTHAAPGLSIEPLNWPVRAFHLVESKTTAAGAVYHSLGHWPLH